MQHTNYLTLSAVWFGVAAFFLLLNLKTRAGSLLKVFSFYTLIACVGTAMVFVIKFTLANN